MNATNSTASSAAAASSGTSMYGTWLWLLLMALINGDVHTNFSRVSWASTVYLSCAAIALLIYLGTNMTSRLIVCWEWRVCPECRRRFSDRKEMLHHLRDHHPREAAAHLRAMGVRFRNGVGDHESDCESDAGATVATARSKGEGSLGRSPTPSDWERCFDVEAGTAYWYNTRTGESSWAEPDGVKADNSAALATREPLSRFLKRQRLEKYYGKLRELGAAKAGDLLELDASMIDGLLMKPLEASRFRRELRLMRVGTQPLDLSRVRDWRERENERATRAASRSGSKRRPVTETQSVIAAGAANDTASVASGPHPASEPPLGRGLSPPPGDTNGHRFSLWRGRGRRVHIAPTDGEEGEASVVASPERGLLASSSPVKRRLSLPPRTPTSPAAATAWKAGSENMLVCRFDDGPLGLGYKQQKNGDVIVVRVQGQTLDGGVCKGDALVDISGESILGKSEMEVMELIEASKRPFTISFRRRPNLPPLPGDNREDKPEDEGKGEGVAKKESEGEIKKEGDSETEIAGGGQNKVMFALKDDDMVENVLEDLSHGAPDSIADAEAAALVEQELELREQESEEAVRAAAQNSTRTTKWLELDQEVAEARAEHELQMGNNLSDEKKDSTEEAAPGKAQDQHKDVPVETGPDATSELQAESLPEIGQEVQMESGADVAAALEASSGADGNERIEMGDADKAEDEADNVRAISIPLSIIEKPEPPLPESDVPPSSLISKPTPPRPRLPPPGAPKPDKPPPGAPKPDKPKPPAPAHNLDGSGENDRDEAGPVNPLQDAIRGTIAAFAPLALERPKLSHKLLARPPFRFLHDLFQATVKVTGFCDGLLEESERDARAFSGRSAKARFIGKVAHVVGACHGGGFECSAIVPLQVITGREPQSTNLFLRAFAECAVAAKAARAAEDDAKSSGGEGEGGAESATNGSLILERGRKAVEEALRMNQVSEDKSDEPAPPAPTEI